MTLNELLIRHNFITKVIFKDGDKELSRDLKVKLMSMRIELGKLRKEFDADVQEVIKGLTPDGYQELAQKENKTDEDNKQMEDWNNEINAGYNTYIEQKGNEEHDVNVSLTPDEFNEILEVNVGNNVNINGNDIPAADFLEILYSLFVEE